MRREPASPHAMQICCMWYTCYIPTKDSVIHTTLSPELYLKKGEEPTEKGLPITATAALHCVFSRFTQRNWFFCCKCFVQQNTTSFSAEKICSIAAKRVFPAAEISCSKQGFLLHCTALPIEKAQPRPRKMEKIGKKRFFWGFLPGKQVSTGNIHFMHPKWFQKETPVASAVETLKEDVFDGTQTRDRLTPNNCSNCWATNALTARLYIWWL